MDYPITYSHVAKFIVLTILLILAAKFIFDRGYESGYLRGIKDDHEVSIKLPDPVRLYDDVYMTDVTITKWEK